MEASATASGLLISWVRPRASRPTAASRSAAPSWARAASSCMTRAASSARDRSSSAVRSATVASSRSDETRLAPRALRIPSSAAAISDSSSCPGSATGVARSPSRSRWAARRSAPSPRASRGRTTSAPIPSAPMAARAIPTATAPGA
ncbi:MAG: hypothetical protein QM767_18970 [Anaeromyxobacter sp.]